jgi:hypothetical protein
MSALVHDSPDRAVTAIEHYGGYPPLGGTPPQRAVRKRTIEARLEVEVQAFERHREWSRREAKAYHTTFRHLSPHVSIHVAGLEMSQFLEKNHIWRLDNQVRNGK